MDFCRFCRARLSEYLDGQLPPSERERVGAHLQTCADCARALGELEIEARLARAALGELAPAPAPADLRFKVRAALQNETARRQSLWGFLPWRAPRSGDATVAAIAKRRWNPAKFAWTGGITFAAIALMILARPDSFSPAPPSLSAPKPDRETQGAPAPLEVAPPRAKPKTAQKPEKKAPRKGVAAPSAAPDVKTAPTAREQAPPREAVLGAAPFPTPAPHRTQPARQPEKLGASPTFRAPSFPPLPTPKAAPLPQMAPPAPRERTALSPPPSAVAPPPASARFRSQPAAPNALPRTVATPTAPRFVVALSAVALPAESQSESLAAKAQNDAARAEVRENGAAAPQAAAPPAAPQARRAETEDRAPETAGALSRSSPSTRALRGADAVPPAVSLARSFQLSVSASRAVPNAQIRLVLPPPLRFSASDASASRTVWRGDLGANSPLVLPLSLHGARGGEKISLFVEQIGAGGKSQVVETQILTVPPRNSE